MELLFQELLNWHQEVSNNLDVKQIEDIRPQIYFEREHRRRREQRASLLRKSITWGLLEMLWFSCNPKSEWLGDYGKLKVK